MWGRCHCWTNGRDVRVDLTTSACGPDADVIVDLKIRMILQCDVRGCDVVVERTAHLSEGGSDGEGAGLAFLEIDHMTCHVLLTVSAVAAAQVSFRLTLNQS